jgi:Rrf2 family transcriptional regulator, cysteine metabolism repressor
MRVSRSTAYALQAALQLADVSGDAPVPCSQLAKAGEMPERFLLQVLRNMVNHGLLYSTRGVEGGYRLARPAEEITLLSIVEATDGPMTSELPPLDGMPDCSRKQLQAVIQDITREVCRRLAQTSLADLLTADAGPAAQPFSEQVDGKT